MALLVLVGTLAHAEPERLSIEVHARALAPGEPLRVDVLASEPLASAQGSFLDRELFLVRQGSVAAEGERWSGWASIPLEGRAGSALLTVRGRTAGGSEVRGSHEVTIAERGFPEEKLRVDPDFVKPPREARARIDREHRRLEAVYRERRPVPAPQGPFVRPVPGEPTSTFGTRRLFNGRPRAAHPGLDLRAAAGTPVVASGDGRVALADDLYYSGRTVIVDHGGGLFTVYAHLSRMAVRAGETVAAGQQVGWSGATGRVTGPHLHWGAKIGNEPFDPTALLEPVLFR